MKINELLATDKNLQEQGFYDINTLGVLPPKEKKPGLLSRFGRAVSSGIKQGANIRPDISLSRGLASKALQAANMPFSAAAVSRSAPPAAVSFSSTQDQTLSTDLLTKFGVGTVVTHPSLGKMRVKRANANGVTFDTKNTLGHDLTMTPGQLKSAFSYR